MVTSRSVAQFADETWTVFQENQGFEGSRFFDALTVDALGRPWAAHSSGVDVFENGAWRTIGKDDFNTPQSLAIDAQGQVWFGTLISGVQIFDGTAWSSTGATRPISMPWSRCSSRARRVRWCR